MTRGGAVLVILTGLLLGATGPREALAADVLVVQDTPATVDQIDGGEFGLPERTPPPRTLREQWPVFVVLSLFWLGVVGYVLTFNGRLRRLEAALGSASGASPEGGRRT